MLNQRLELFLSRSDVKQNPVKALWKRFSWRIRWSLTKRPYIIPFAGNLKIAIPKSGSGASIYYRGLSEPETADFITRFLKPGMVVVDVGAHIGEYTLLAARGVGTSGQVHGFEPQPSLFPLLRENVEMNGFKNVTLNCLALSDRMGEIEFEVFAEPSVSSIRKHTIHNGESQLVRVTSTSLDTYWSEKTSQYNVGEASTGVQRIDLIKVDVEGAEKFVFEGASKLLSSSSTEAPTWIFECSNVSYASFEYQPQDLIDFLKKHDYEVFKYSIGGKIEEFQPHQLTGGLVNLIATKNRNNLISLLDAVNINTSRPQVSV